MQDFRDYMAALKYAGESEKQKQLFLGMLAVMN